MKSPVLFLSLVLCSIFSLCNCVNITQFEEGPCTPTKYITVVEEEDFPEEVPSCNCTATKYITVDKKSDSSKEGPCTAMKYITVVEKADSSEEKPCTTTKYITVVEKADSSEEGPCTATEYITVDEKSVSSEGEIWYFPILSKYELYQSASLVSGIPVKDLTDVDIKKSCLISKVENGKLYLEGFGGMKIEIIGPSAGKLGGFWMKLKKYGKERSMRILSVGKYWRTLIAKDFFVTVDCWTITGHHSFSAASKTKTVDAETKEKVIKHVTSLGFNPKYIHDYSYDGCQE